MHVHAEVQQRGERLVDVQENRSGGVERADAARERALGGEPPLGRVGEEGHGLQAAAPVHGSCHLDVGLVGVAFDGGGCIPSDRERAHESPSFRMVREGGYP